MADFNHINQFGSAKPGRSGAGMTCAECEALVTDAIDGTLSAKDQAAFELHVSTCPECSRMLTDAQRGAALLEMLKAPRPEPSALLLDRIIAQTTGQASSEIGGRLSPPAVTTPFLVGHSADISSGNPQPGAVNLPPALANAAVGNVLPFRSPGGRFSLHSIGRTMVQPRLAMTAAMAFFSIALTLNLTGIRLNEIKASDLKPSSLKRSFYQADASLVRYYDNLRVVYELESRLRDLKRSNDSEEPPAADAKDGKNKTDQDQQRKQSPKAGSGTSRRDNPLQQEFKLASGRSSGHHSFVSNLAGLRGEVEPRTAYKLKEETQEEGGLV